MAGSGDAGVVYVSLGTVCSIGVQEFRELAAAVSATPARVIWKVGADDLPEGVSLAALSLGDNVKVRPPGLSPSTLLCCFQRGLPRHAC